MDESEVRFRFAVARQMRSREGGDSQTARHVSVRDEDHETFGVTPVQCFDETLPRRLREPEPEVFEWAGDALTARTP